MPSREDFFTGIAELIKMGIISREQCPEEHYWHWSVIKADELPNYLIDSYLIYGEIRYYWN